MEIINEANYSIVELISNYNQDDEDAIHMLKKIIMVLTEHPSTSSGV